MEHFAKALALLVNVESAFTRGAPNQICFGGNERASGLQFNQSDE
jgi:hypothetical protein